MIDVAEKPYSDLFSLCMAFFISSGSGASSIIFSPVIGWVKESLAACRA